MTEKTLRVIVADDERVSRQRLARLLRKEPGVEVVAECVGGKDAVESIEKLKPDIAFLDIKMPDLTGLDVALSRADSLTAIVFVTAFDEFAARAFEVNAADYLLKPVEASRLRQSLARVRDRATSRTSAADLREILEGVSERLAAMNGPGEGTPLERVAVRVAGVLKIVKTSDIDWIGSEGNYVALHVGNARHLVRSTVTDFEQQLDRRRFIRVHRQFIVNIDRVREVHPWFSGDAILIMTTGAKVRLARSYRERFHQALGADATVREPEKLSQGA
jgi:two-component system LytT family response regulator